MQNTQYCATGTTRGGTELTVSRISTTLANKYLQHALAICKEIESLRYIMYIVGSRVRHNYLTTLLDTKFAVFSVKAQ